MRYLILLGLVLPIYGCHGACHIQSPPTTPTAVSATESPQGSAESQVPKRSLYLPEEGKAWFFIGQDLGAVGGLDKYDDGYVDYIGTAAGVTIYTGVPSLAGLYTPDNWDAGDCHAQAYLEDDTFMDAMIAIGFQMVDELQNIVDGKHAESIKRLGQWITAANRPVFLRIGYEFEGPWNHYDPELYKQAFRIIVDQLNDMGVTNYVTVWQSSGYKETVTDIMKWYPGDEYVDWLGYSFFDHYPETAGNGIRQIARKVDKPVMIAELTPRGWDLMVQDGPAIWEGWFEKFFSHYEENADIIKAVAYINVRWKDQPMWKGQGWGDTRIQSNAYVRQKWLAELKKGRWVHLSVKEDQKPFVAPANIAELKLVAKSSPIDTRDVYEAERATPTGNAKPFDSPRASGTGGMAYIHAEGDSVWFDNTPKAKSITIRYAAPHDGKIGIYVNDKRKADFRFIATGSWATVFHTLTQKVKIPKGAKIAIQWDKGDKAVNVDYIKFD